MIVRKKRILVLAVFLLALCCGAYVWLVYHGYVLLNNPSKRKYPVVGVDLSHYQGAVDWPVLSGQEITFVYIKATEGSGHVDSRFSQNWEEAEKTDLKVGAYHFFSFDSPGVTLAENFISQVVPYDGMLPPAVDVEYYADKREHPPEAAAVREQLQVMLDRLEAHYGMRPVIYCTEEVWDAYLDGCYEAYPLWIRNVFTKPGISDPWTFWQYSNRGRLSGYTGDEEFIDLNVFYGDRAAWEEWLTSETPVETE